MSKHWMRWWTLKSELEAVYWWRLSQSQKLRANSDLFVCSLPHAYKNTASDAALVHFLETWKSPLQIVNSSPRVACQILQQISTECDYGSDLNLSWWNPFSNP
jgi:hypothetical protein